MSKTSFVLAIPNYDLAQSPYTVIDNIFVQKTTPLQLNNSHDFSNIMTSNIEEIVNQIAQNSMYEMFTNQNQIFIVNTAIQNLALGVEFSKLLMIQLYQCINKIEEEFDIKNISLQFQAVRYTQNNFVDLFGIDNNKTSIFVVDLPSIQSLASKLDAIVGLYSREQMLENSINLFINQLPSDQTCENHLLVTNQQLNQMLRQFETNNSILVSSNPYLKAVGNALRRQTFLTSICILQDDLNKQMEMQKQYNYEYEKNLLTSKSTTNTLFQSQLKQLDKKFKVQINDYQLLLVQQFSSQSNIKSSISTTIGGISDSIRLEHLQKHIDIFELEYQDLTSQYDEVRLNKQTQFTLEQKRLIQNIMLRQVESPQQISVNSEVLEQIQEKVQQRAARAFQIGTSVDSPVVDSIIFSAACQLTSEQTQAKLVKLNELTSRSEILRPSDKDKIMQEQRLVITKLIEDENREQSGYCNPNLQISEKVTNIGEMKQSQLAESLRIIQNTKILSFQQMMQQGMLQSRWEQDKETTHLADEKLLLYQLPINDVIIAVSKNNLLEIQGTSNVSSLFDISNPQLWKKMDQVTEHLVYYRKVSGFCGFVIDDIVLVCKETQMSDYLKAIQQLYKHTCQE